MRNIHEMRSKKGILDEEASVKGNRKCNDNFTFLEKQQYQQKRKIKSAA